GAERVAVCSSSFTETDEVVSNVVSFASSGPATNEESVGIVIFGNPPVVLPTGWPVGKGCITQGPDGSYSHGGTEAIDIGSVSTGTAVRATFNGVVQTACWASGDGCDPDGYGNYVRLSSLNGNFSAVFGHLATTSVKSGDQVTVGQQVGTVDNTGNSSGTHLHYEFRSLPMAEPYIPRDTGSHGSIRGCSDASECGLCF
ncbi:MAG: Membrane-bound metallopeptidase, partial [candidate division WWE3 bacterium CSP1-7]